MVLRRGRPTACCLVLIAVLGVSAAGCGGDGGSAGSSDLQPAATAVASSASATAAASSLMPTTTPAASATAARPLSRFEDDQAVRVLRVFLLQSALAVNARNLDLPALNAVSTPARRAANKESYGSDLGGYAPGPYPALPLGVRVVSSSRRIIPLCAVASGWVLTRKGGTPREAVSVGGGEATMVKIDGTWRVASIVRSTSVSCTGLTIPRPTFS